MNTLRRTLWNYPDKLLLLNLINSRKPEKFLQSFQTSKIIANFHIKQLLPKKKRSQFQQSRHRWFLETPKLATANNFYKRRKLPKQSKFNDWENSIDARHFTTSCQSNKTATNVHNSLTVSPRTSNIKDDEENNYSSLFRQFSHYIITVCCLLCEAFDRHRKKRLLRSINEVFVPFVKNICNKTNFARVYLRLTLFTNTTQRVRVTTQQLERLNSASTFFFFFSINLNIIDILYCSCLYIIMLLFLCALSGDGIRRRRLLLCFRFFFILLSWDCYTIFFSLLHICLLAKVMWCAWWSFITKAVADESCSY